MLTAYPVSTHFSISYLSGVAHEQYRRLEMSDDRANVLAVNSAFYRAFEKRDLDAMQAVWSQGVASICVHPGRSPITGWPEIGDSWSTIFANVGYIEVDTDLVSIEVIDRLGYVVTYESVLQVVKRRRIQGRSLATNIFERMGDRWLLVHHHGSPIVD